MKAKMLGNKLDIYSGLSVEDENSNTDIYYCLPWELVTTLPPSRVSLLAL